MWISNAFADIRRLGKKMKKEEFTDAVWKVLLPETHNKWSLHHRQEN
jgi:hypothetical protein